jgi:predicted metalloprotease with PDZ domain
MFPLLVAAAIQLSVDATEAPHNLLHAKLRIPVTAGEVTLAYPKWMPGNHRPSGPIQNLTGLVFEAGGKRVEWRRDPVDMYTFHVQVPPGVSELGVSLDAITDDGVAGSSGAAASTHVMDVNWNWVVLYPAQASSDDVQVAASIRLPSGWKFASALEPAKQKGDDVTFKPVSLTMLIDSPLIAGDHFKRVQLDRQHALDIVAESEDALALTAADQKDIAALVEETGALFGARHYRHYDFLLTLSSQVGGRGLEHHESSDNAPGERFLIDPKQRMLEAGLLPHEYAHSWNGKYRRPAGLATKNYQQPMIGELLWVYEGLTEYLGGVLAVRSGLRNAEQYREGLALTAAHMEAHRGRRWRSLEDTALSVQTLRMQGSSWSSWRRGLDYYPEGDLIWLEVDTIIRKQSGGKKSLDDFCRAFFGGDSGQPRVAPYKLDDVVAALNAVAPYDWAKHLHSRTGAVSDHAPTGGIEAAGWKLVYNDKPNVFDDARERVQDYSFSLGFALDQNHKLIDIIEGSPAWKAGLRPHMIVVAINGRKYSNELLKDALKNKRPMAILVEDADFMQTYNVNYIGGPRHPHLERGGTPDLLQDIVKPRRAH